MRYKIAEWTAQLAVRSVFFCQRVGFVNFPSDLRHPGRQSDAIGNKLTSCRLVDKIKVKSLTVKSEILTGLVSHTNLVGDTNSVNESTISKGLTTTRDS